MVKTCPSFLKPFAVGTPVLLSAMVLSNGALAEPTGYNQLTFTTKVKTDVANDEVNASLYKKAQADDAKTLADILNNSINQAVAIAKRYPKVKVTSGRQNTYPRYDKNDKIIGWTGQANINLNSQDFAATSELIADLQQTLVMENLYFSVSDQKRDAIQTQLMSRASKMFQDQAQNLANVWNAKGYRMLKVDLNASRDYHRPMAAPVVVVSSRMESDVAAPNLESGESSISVTANGTIELIK